MIDTVLSEYQVKIQAHLDILLPESGQLYDTVVRAQRYGILDGGKRIRPIILLEFYKLCGGEDDCAYKFAAALEMIHSYSLIHDDLPCMDDDDMRRGKPSCHKQFGEATALLAGDALLTDAFAVASKTLGIASDRVVEALSVLASCAGTNGMVGGQMIDLETEVDGVTSERIITMYRLKTGALIKAAAQIGCILAGADKSLQDKAIEYADSLGVAFQVVDDILDFEGDAAVLGKPTGSDIKNNKNTLIGLLGIEECRKMAAELTQKALDALECFPGDTNVLKELTKALLIRKN